MGRADKGRGEEPSFRDYTKLCNIRELESMLRFLKAEAAYDKDLSGEWYYPYDLYIRVVEDQLAVLRERRKGSSGGEAS